MIIDGILSIVIWIIIIRIIVKLIHQKQEKEETPNEDWKVFPREDNSYYTKEKVAQYQSMERDHLNHEEEEDVSQDIGYKRCPRCETFNSKKADVCFICDYSFKGNEK